MAAPAFDRDLGSTQRVEALAIEQLVAQATSLTSIWRIASAMLWPCETRISTCRNCATISSGLYRFLGISALLEHDPEKACPGHSRPKDGVASLAYDPGWEPVFGKDHAQTRS
jgi:hypothetical protein